MTQSQAGQYARALTIATSDSGGGAGIQDLPAEFAALQIDTVVEDLGVDAVKIGVLFNAGIIGLMRPYSPTRFHKRKVWPSL